jgi:hypothetical protein
VLDVRTLHVLNAHLVEVADAEHQRPLTPLTDTTVLVVEDVSE